jgi:uncharacterized protein YbaP (TraB family)
MKILNFALLIFFAFTVHAQVKYQGLLWEISGNGLSKPSYLYGTMHVSDKVAFHLGDSFYLALKNVDVVALETNPENWQDDFTKSNFYKGNTNYTSTSSSALTASDFRIYEYDRILKVALNKDPQMVNGMLYRTYMQNVDFEENTFLDMYIFQTGKKYGKVLTGVEDFEKTEKLVAEAYEDMSNDKNKRKYRNDLNKDTHTASNDAYRRGDLDMMDSITRMEFLSDAFLEKFIYVRNANMVHSIDSIVKRSSLFVGVGCAHLPGNRGVIKQLRDMGYTMRPVYMGERNSVEKDKMDNKIIHLNFSKQYTTDSLIEVDLPGRLYHFPDYDGFDQHQFADMINGAFYLVTRVKTYATLRGQDENYVLKKLDSILYENIPGKILTKKSIRKDGYNGFDITTKTRRGDMHRFQIFITPLEVIIFKAGGNAEFVKGEEGEKFFNSIKIKNPDKTDINSYNASKASFTVDFPAKPIDLYTFSRDARFGENFIGCDENNNTYLVMKKTFHNYSYFEEDTIELNTMNEGFASSFPNQLRELKQHYSIVDNYPALDVWYRNFDSTTTHARYTKRGVNYYLIASRYKSKEKKADDFFESFKYNPLKYEGFKTYKDTSLYFTVTTPMEPLEEHKAINSYSGSGNNHKNEVYDEEIRSKTFEDKNTGEKIFVNFHRYKKFDNYKDTNNFFSQMESKMNNDEFIVKQRKKNSSTPLFRGEFLFTDTNSMLCTKRLSIVKGHVLYTVTTQYDSIAGESEFIKTFFSTFAPSDTTIGMHLFAPVADTLFSNYYSTDSTLNAQAKESIPDVVYYDYDAPKLMKAIGSVKNGDDYMKTKIRFINELGYLKKNNTIVPFVKEQYVKCGDTAGLQIAYLKVLARLKTEESISAFRELILKETPLSNDASDIRGLFTLIDDTLKLAKKLYPDLLSLSILDEYKYKVYGLLSMLKDSGYVTTAVYDNIYKQLLSDARAEQKRNIAKEDSKTKSYNNYSSNGYYQETRLEDFTVLLMPYDEKDANVKQYLNKLMLIPVSELKLNLALLFIRNNRPVADSILDTIASIDFLRTRLYMGLVKIKKEKMFPSKYLTREKIARSNLLNSTSSYARPDTLVFLKTTVTDFKFKTGVVYFYKYKNGKEDDDWKIGIVGLQPQDTMKYDFNDALTSLTGAVLKEDKPLDDQLNKALRSIKKARKHKSGYYGYYNYGADESDN